MSVSIGFDGCQLSENISPWSISWPSTGRNKTAKQKCPGSSESVGMVCCKLCTISAPNFMDNPEKISCFALSDWLHNISYKCL